MRSEQRKPTIKGRLVAIGKGVWYLCATILVLSLPTFSYLLPDLKTPLRETFPSLLSAFGSSHSGAEFEFEKLSSRNNGTGNSAEPGTSRFVSSRSGFVNGGPDRRSGIPRHITNVSGLAGSPGVVAGDRPAGASRTSQVGGVGETGVGDPGLYRELSQMDSDYEMTMSSLYSGAAIGGSFGRSNPFSEALKDSESDNDSDKGDSGSQGDSGDSGTGDGGDGADGQGTDGQGTDGGDNGGDPPPSDGNSTAPSFNFLVLTEPGTLAPGFATRAFSDGSGSLSLEDGSTLELFSGVVNFPRPVYVASEGQMVSFELLSADGLVDVVAANPWSQGFQLQALYNYGDGWYIGAELSQAFISVSALAAFDSDADGAKELVVCFEGESLLSIFEFVGGEIFYSRDLVLPFVPAILATTRDTVFQTGYLHVWDTSLKKSVLFSTRYPGVYSYSKPSTYQGIEVVELDPPVPGGERFGLISYKDRLVVTSNYGASYHFLASFMRAPSLPLVVIGDYSETGLREVIVLP